MKSEVVEFNISELIPCTLEESFPSYGQPQEREEVQKIKRKFCKNCKRWLPLEEYYKDVSSRDGLTRWCKSCDKNASKQFRVNNPEYFIRYRLENRDQILETIRQCLFLRRPHSGGGFLNGTGICVFCGETNPFRLEAHHIFGRDNALVVHLCGSCHLVLHRFPKLLEEN